MKKNATLLTTVALLAGGISFSQVVTTYNYTGAVQTYSVPGGVTNIHIEMTGASAGYCDYGGSAPAGFFVGLGGKLEADLDVIPGSTLNIYVGGEGSDASSASGGLGGYNGGGTGGTTGTYSGGGGGGASDIRIGGTALTDRVMVVGGGGGAAYNYGSGDDGGDGGGLIGLNGQSNNNPGDVSCGQGGTQIAGGLAGQWSGYAAGTPGALGIGGNGATGTSGGGAGGGYYGGGGGSWSGGGGGSSYTNVDASNVIHTQGFNTGNGQVIVTVFCTGLTTTVSATTLCSSDLLTLSAVSVNGGNITWDLGVIDNTPFQPDTSGLVTYTATSDHPDDCDFTVDVMVLEEPELTLSTSDDFGSNNGGVYVTIVSGLFPFTYDWDNDGTGDFDDPQNLTGLSVGTYTVVMEHGNGCTATASATVNSQVGIDESKLDVLVYPNPVSDVLNIQLQGGFNYVVTDVTGNIIQSSAAVNSEQISTENFAAGIYFIRVQNELSYEVYQFVKN